MLLSIRNADVSYGGDNILSNVSFDLREGEKTAIVGRNGCGKTTLLKLISGELTPQPKDGNAQPSVVFSGRPSIGWLSQMAFSDESVYLGDELRSVFKPVLALKEKMDAYLVRLNAGDSSVAEEYAAMEERFHYLGGYRFEKDYEQLYARFGFLPEEEGRPLSEFSGGQRTKIAFIKLLLTRPDILLLDEPTNHLDISTIAWLEGYIAEYPKAVVLVSHDRLFLDRVAESIYEIERGHIKRYVGNYSDFAKQKKLEHEQQLKLYEAQQKEKARLEAVAERFIHKATKASMAKSKLKAVEHMELIEKPEEADVTAFRAICAPKRESGKDVLDCEHLAVGYTEVLCRVSLSLKRGRKLGIIGGNGLGKSTFLKTIAGRLNKLGGKYSYGYGVDTAYFEQQMAAAAGEKTVIDEFWDAYPSLTETEVRNILGGFLFRGDDVFKRVSEISGGERVRLVLAKLLQTGPNLLLLDEPTNHMDIVGKEALEDMLSAYTGTVIFVSHDRYLVRRLADELLIFTRGGAEYFPFGYEEYERHYGKEKTAAAAELWKIDGDKAGEAAADKGAEKKEKAKNPGKERARAERRLARLEQLIDENDAAAAALRDKMAQPEYASNYEELTKLQAELDALIAQADAYMEEWEELERQLA